MYTFAVIATTIFFIVFAFAVLPAIVASIIEDKWKSGMRTTLLGYDSQSFSNTFSQEPLSHKSKPSGLSLWPYGPQRSVGFGGAISRTFVGWQDYRGRATRSEFWWWYLLELLVNLVPAILILITQTFLEDTAQSFVVIVGGFAGGLFLVATFLPSLALYVRRLHDTDRSGWWLLIVFVPIAGLIVLLVFFLMPSTKGPNRYGSPSMESQDQDFVSPQKVS